jgi:hypothetical protein
MKTRDNMSAVIEGLQSQHSLLGAYLVATDKIDWRALHKRVVIDKRVVIAETPKPANVEAHQVSAAPHLSQVPQSPEVVPSTSPFVFRRAGCEHY